MASRDHATIEKLLREHVMHRPMENDFALGMERLKGRGQLSLNFKDASATAIWWSSIGTRRSINSDRGGRVYFGGMIENHFSPS